MTHAVAALPNPPNHHIICLRNAINVVGKLFVCPPKKRGKGDIQSKSEEERMVADRTTPRTKPANMQVQGNRKLFDQELPSQRVVCQQSSRNPSAKRPPPHVPSARIST